MQEDYLQIGVVVVDSEAKILLAGNSISCFIPYQPDEIIGRYINSIGLPKEIIDYIEDTIKDGSETVESAGEFVLTDLIYRIVGVVVSKAHFDNLHENTFLVTITDLTNIKLHERGRKEFVGNICHELRTPIAGLRVTAEALLSGAKDDEVLLDRFLNTIVYEADRLSDLIEDMTEIVRLDSGIAKSPVLQVNALELIQHSIAVLTPIIDELKQTVQINVSNQLIVPCDERRLLHAIRNIIDNAVKFTPVGGTIVISAKEDQSKVIITVSDTGIGIPQDEVSRIFERFYRVDRGRSRKFGGTGLGLPLAKAIVESHNGTIAVESVLGKGCKFTIELPLH